MLNVTVQKVLSKDVKIVHSSERVIALLLRIITIGKQKNMVLLLEQMP